MVIGAVNTSFAIAATICMRPAQAVAQAISLRGSGNAALGVQCPCRPFGAGLSTFRWAICSVEVMRRADVKPGEPVGRGGCFRQGCARLAPCPECWASAGE